jgi:hypothetical protein
MKKSLLSVVVLTFAFIFYLGQTGLLDYSQFSPGEKSVATLGQNEEVREEIDEVDFSAAAIKRNNEELTTEIDQEMSEKKKELIENILVVSEVANYQENITRGIESSLKSETDDAEKKEFLKKFANSLMDYPMAEEFKNILANYSEKELDYLHNSFKHPANQQAMAVQKERIDELTEITKSEQDYLPTPEKQEIIAEIIEASNALEHGAVIGDATTKPIFMAIHKKQNPNANIHEMEAFANKLMATTKPKQTQAMTNVIHWSFDQVDKDKLESYRQYVNQGMDRKTNDKYLEDMKKFYGKYGKFIGEELVKLMSELEKDKNQSSDL